MKPILCLISVVLLVTSMRDASCASLMTSAVAHGSDGEHVYLDDTQRDRREAVANQDSELNQTPGQERLRREIMNALEDSYRLLDSGDVETRRRRWENLIGAAIVGAHHGFKRFFSHFG